MYQDNDTNSGFPLDRYFCINCGSNMFVQSNRESANAIRIVTLGSLDSPTDWGTSLGPLSDINFHCNLI